MKDFKEQWNKVDMEFFHQFLQLHNEVCLEEKTQADFNTFVLENKTKIDNPDYLQIFIENVRIFDKDFYKENFDMCKTFYDFMENNPDWSKLDFGFRTAIRLGSFEDDFKEYLKTYNI